MEEGNIGSPHIYTMCGVCSYMERLNSSHILKRLLIVICGTSYMENIESFPYSLKALNRYMWNKLTVKFFNGCLAL